MDEHAGITQEPKTIQTLFPILVRVTVRHPAVQIKYGTIDIYAQMIMAIFVFMEL
jgi:hypothetical protein